MAIVAAAAVTAGSQLIGSSQANKATNKASDAQVQIADKNNALAREFEAKNEANLQPFMGQGASANGQINTLLATNPFAPDASQFEVSPDFNFRLNTGLDNVNARMGAGNSLQSGGRLKALEAFRNDLASSEFGNWYNRQRGQGLDYFNALAGQQGVGLSAASALAGVGQNYVGQVSGNNQNAADARSNAALVNGQNTANLWNGIGNTAANLVGQSSFGRGASGLSAQPVDPFRGMYG